MTTCIIFEVRAPEVERYIDFITKLRESGTRVVDATRRGWVALLVEAGSCKALVLVYPRLPALQADTALLMQTAQGFVGGAIVSGCEDASLEAVRLLLRVSDEARVALIPLGTCTTRL